MTPPPSDWLDIAPIAEADDVLHVDVEGYEGPLDVLLDLARRQKVDLGAIAIRPLADQYLAFIQSLREKRIELAADYLVMAAWLAYLKSRLMLPADPADDEPSGEMLAAMLQFRLRRLEAMRDAAGRLLNQPRLGLAVFARGAPEPVNISRRVVWDVTLYDLLKSYSGIREKATSAEYTPHARKVWSLQDAREILQRLIGDSVDWVPMDRYLAQYLPSDEQRITAVASSFASSLELVRLGAIDLKQTETFGPLFMRRRKDAAS